MSGGAEGMTGSPLCVFPKERVCFMSVELVYSPVLPEWRKPNRCKTSGEITRNWRPFKNITTALFPQQGVEGWETRFRLELEMS